MQKAFKLFGISSAESSITSDMQVTPPLTAKSEEELKSLLKVKEEAPVRGVEHAGRGRQPARHLGT